MAGSPCHECAVGDWTSTIGALSCTNCGSGFTTSGMGSTSYSQCMCAVGFFLSDGECLACSAQRPRHPTTAGTGSTSIDQCICATGDIATCYGEAIAGEHITMLAGTMTTHDLITSWARLTLKDKAASISCDSESEEACTWKGSSSDCVLYVLDIVGGERAK